jgi:hypothetical protein
VAINKNNTNGEGKKVIKENIRKASFYGNEMAPPPIVPSRATHPLFISFAYSHI